MLGIEPVEVRHAQLYCEKLELAEPDDAESEAMEWGLLLEPIIAERYAGVTRRELAPVEPFTIYRSRAHTFMTATFDRLILGDPRGLGILQIQAVGAFKAEDWEDEPPVYYEVQTQQEAAVAGATWGSLAVLIGGQRFGTSTSRNDRFLSVLVAREEAFWNRLLAQEPPEVDGSDSAREILKRLYPKETPGLVVNLPAEAIEWDAELRQLKDLGKEYEGRRRRSKIVSKRQSARPRRASARTVSRTLGRQEQAEGLCGQGHNH